jgi:hypothetical protein
MDVSGDEQMRIEGPCSRCATEYGYGEYYLAVADGIEWGHVCLARGQTFDGRTRRNLLRRANRSRERGYRG